MEVLQESDGNENNSCEYAQFEKERICVDTTWNGYGKKAKRVLEELEKNHQCSIYEEIYQRNRNNKDRIALLYRGVKVTYGTLFEKVDKYTNCLVCLGYKKGDEIPICMKMCPEFVYLFLAISKIGAIMNSLGEWFDKSYMIHILNQTKSDYLFVTSNYFQNIEEAVLESRIKKIVSFNLDASLPEGKNIFEQFDASFVNFHVSAPDLDYVMDSSQFLSLANTETVIKGKQRITLDDTFTITYTSGTTNPEQPKAVVHAVRSYMTISRFKDPDISGLGTMKNLVALAHFPTYVHAGITTTITDPLFRSCCIALEPVYDKNFFIYSLMLNKPNFVCAGVGFWSDVAKKMLYDDEFKHVTMPYLFVATVSGEGMSKGEERFFNKVSRIHKFGVDKLPFPLSPIKFTIGGGTSESSGVLVTLYKKIQEKRPYYILTHRTIGLMPLGCCKVKVINEYGRDCKVNEVGELIISGPCSMKGYAYQTSLDLRSTIVDKDGVIWLKTGTYGSIDKKKTVKIHGRMSDHITLCNGDKYPFYNIEEVLENIKMVLSSTVVAVGDNLIVHVEPRPDMYIDKKEFMELLAKKISNICPMEIINNIYLRFRDNKESFPIAPSGKRDRGALIEEGTKFAIKLCKNSETN